MPSPVLRPFQEDLLGGARAEYAAGARSVVLSLPTGGGKTFTFCAAVARAVEQGRRAWIVVHTRNLVKQTIREVRRFNLEPGVVAGGYKPMPEAPVQVCSVQTLVRRLDALPAPDLVVFDEAHHTLAGQHMAVVRAAPESWILGPTATPLRTDGSALGDVYDAMVTGPSPQWLADQGYLVEPELWTASVPDLAGLKRTRRGDWSPADLERAMASRDLIGDGAASFRQYFWPGARTAVFCASRAHVAAELAAFRASGIAAEPLLGNMGADEQEAVLARLAAGKTEAVLTVDVISEGTDVPALDGVISRRPTDSVTVWLQQTGRSLRPCRGKERAVIVDAAGNIWRHGSPLEDREFSLTSAPSRSDDEVDEEGRPLSLRQCGCGRMWTGGSHVCPACGRDNGPDPRIPKARAAELRRVSAEDAERARKARRARERAEEAQCETLSDWQALARERGHAPGWAWHRHNARQGRRGARG